MTAPTLTTQLNPEDPQVQARAAHNRALAQELRAKLFDIGAGRTRLGAC